MTDSYRPSSMERAIALTEITATINSFAVAARDSTTWEEKAPNVTQNCHITLPTGQKKLFSDFAQGEGGRPTKFFRHHITGINVEFISETKAKATTQVFAMTALSSLDHWGEWHDTLVKGENGRWLIEEKQNFIDGWDPKGWYASLVDGKKEKNASE